MLPYYTLGHEGVSWRVLVPLRSEEALWIAFVIRPGLSLAGSTIAGLAVHVTTLTTSRNEIMLAADAIDVAGSRRPIDAAQIAFAETRSATEHDHLRFSLTNKAGDEAGQLGVVLAVSALYESISGLSAPQSTSTEHGYGGWRLP